MSQIKQQSDHDVKLAIIEALSKAAGVNADHVGVAITDGVVTVSGEVLTYPEKAAALQAVEDVRGTRSVVDGLKVQTPWGAGDDADLAHQAAAALDNTGIHPAGMVVAEVNDRVITLRGTVAYQHQRTAFHLAMTELPGVITVHDAITVQPPRMSTAEDIQTLISRALVSNVETDVHQIHVKVTGTEVTLFGTVCSHDEVRQAEGAAASASGVSMVHNRLSVRRREPDQNGS